MFIIFSNLLGKILYLLVWKYNLNTNSTRYNIQKSSKTQLEVE